MIDHAQSPPHAPRRPKARGALAAFVLASIGFDQPAFADGGNGGPYYTLDAQMLVCPDRLIFMPTLTTSGTDQSYTRTFTAYVAATDGNTEPIGVPNTPSRRLTKSNLQFDDLNFDDEMPYVVVAWDEMGPTPTLQIFSNGVKDFSAPIPAPITVAFDGGSGTLTDPYLVSTADQLQSISCQDDTQLRYYALTRDIDLAGRNFIPIGFLAEPFRGGIDGRGFTIANLTMHFPALTRIGFIGNGDEFFLRDIRFTNPRVHGRAFVGVALGYSPDGKTSFMRNVVIEGGVVRAPRMLGGLAGRAGDFSVSHAHLDVDMIVSTPPYHGPLSSIAFAEVGWASTQIGGVIGNATSRVTITGGTFDVSIAQDDHVASVSRPSAMGGLIGRMGEDEILVSGVAANVAIDLTVDGLQSGASSSGGLFGRGLDGGNGFTDSTATVNARFVATPAAADAGGFPAFGAIAGSSAEGLVKRVDVRGSIVIDTSAITAGNTVMVERIGGALGVAGSNTVFLHDSHVDVDVTILGTHTTTMSIGGLVGSVDRFIASDVLVGGRVSIEDAADGVAGLVGDFADDPSIVPAHFQSVIYRGEGVTVGADSTNVGVLWGNLGGLTPGAGNVYTGANVFWDANRNGVGIPVAGELGLPATSPQLGDLAWLTGTADFDPTVWCVTNDEGMSVPAVIAVTPACRDGAGGGDVEPTVPSAPSNLTAVPANARVTLRWNPPASDGGREADVYTIQLRAVGTSSWTSLHPYGRCIPDTLTCGVATDLMNGRAYEFRVAAENEVGRGPWSSIARATPGTTPDAPANVTAAADDGAVTLTWVAPADDGGYPIATYLLEMTAGVGSAWMPIAPTPCANPTCAVVSGLANGVTYAFRIAAVNALGAGAWSGVVTAQPIRNPAAPTNLAATPGNGVVTLSWNAPADTGGLPVTYAIELSSDGGVGWAAAIAIPCTPASATCATIPNLTNGVAYAFRVTASTSVGVSPAAGPVLATPQAPTDVPVITRTIPGADRGWFIIAAPTAATVGHEISLDDGGSWQTVTPHVGDRVIRITGLANGTTYRVQLRSVRSDGSKSEPSVTTTLMPTGIRIGAPNLTVALDPESVAIENAGGRQTIAIDILMTNAGGTALTDVWLRPNLPADATLVGFDTTGGAGTWVALDDWWYGESVHLAVGATQRVRVTLETRP